MTKSLVEQVFKAIDKKDAAGFVSFLSEDAVFRFGNAPAISGRPNIQKGVSDFFSSIKGLQHRILNIWEQGDVIICEGEVTYTRNNDDKLTLPFADILRAKGGLICDYKIYIDISGLFAKRWQANSKTNSKTVDSNC